MTIDLRKRLEELERENADLRERLTRVLIEMDKEREQSVSELEATGPQFWIRTDEVLPDNVLLRITDRTAELSRALMPPAEIPKHEHAALWGLDPETRKQSEELDRQAREDMYPHYKPGAVIKAAPAPTIYQRMKRLLQWN